MSDNADKNVLNLDDYGQFRRSVGSGPAGRALRDTRELAASRLKQHISRMMEKIDDALFARAEKAESNAMQMQYFDAMRELRIIRQDIEDDFIESFYTRFSHGVPRESGEATGLSFNFEDDELGLVEKNDLEENLAISNMVSRARGTCRQSLYSLDKRIGYLIRDPDLERWQNPAGPESICDAFREAAQRIETGLEIRLVIFKLFEHHVINQLDEIYTELNQQLVQLGVMPEIKASVPKNVPPTPHAHARGPGNAVPQSDSGTTPASPQVDVGCYSQGKNTPQPHAGYYREPAQASIGALTLLQHAGAGQADITDTGIAVDPAVLASGQVNILHGIKDSSLIQGLGKAGDMTIDVVAMLFDYILDDKSIPDAMRALIGRLQIPILKVALLDNEFFRRKSHPARQLLNRLAATALSWNEQHGCNDPVYRKVEATVQAVLDQFEDDISLFASLLDDIEAFFNKEEERAEVRADRSVKVMEGQERLAVARSTTMSEIESRVSDTSCAPFVRDFVSTHWKNLLFITCARQGRDSDAWQQAVATMDDLIWSVKPKRTLEERKRLVAIQPSLLINLRAGMERLSVPSAERDEFIARLVHAHGRTAVKAKTGIYEASHDEETATAEKPVAPAPAVSETAEKTVPARINDQYMAKVERMYVGTWLEFTGADGQSSRAKLSWISPITSTYLFTDRQGLKAGIYSPEELAALLRSARAKILNRTPLMDRAVSTVLKDFEEH